MRPASHSFLQAPYQSSWSPSDETPGTEYSCCNVTSSTSRPLRWPPSEGEVSLNAQPILGSGQCRAIILICHGGYRPSNCCLESRSNVNGDKKHIEGFGLRPHCCDLCPHRNDSRPSLSHPPPPHSDVKVSDPLSAANKGLGSNSFHLPSHWLTHRRGDLGTKICSRARRHGCAESAARALRGARKL